MAQKVKELAAKAYNLSFILWTYMIQEENLLWKLSSELYEIAYYNTHTHKKN